MMLDSRFFYFLAVVSTACLTGCLQAPVKPPGTPLPPQCEIYPEDRAEILQLSDHDFDQTLPNGGWRKYANLGCGSVALDLIDAYLELHKEKLSTAEKAGLGWHAGQIAAMQGDSERAIGRMELAINDREIAPHLVQWNPYVRATIAFLKKDKKALLLERENMLTATSPYHHLNLRIVDSFIRCFQASYKEAYSHQCEPTETEANRIHSLAIPFSMQEDFPTGLQEFFRQKKLILMGENHGTQEIPELFGQLVASVALPRKKTLVALEITQSSQDNLDEFLATGSEKFLKRDPFFTRQDQDGRSSQAMVELLKRLRKIPGVDVLCMDGQNGKLKDQERDLSMAQAIERKMTRYDQTLVLSGNLHSATVLGNQWNRDFQPMAYQLLQMTKIQSDQVLNIFIRSEQVTAWNCFESGEPKCQIHPGPIVATDYSTEVPWNSYFMQEFPAQDGHAATIFLRTLSASLPYLKN